MNSKNRLRPVWDVPQSCSARLFNIYYLKKLMVIQNILFVALFVSGLWPSVLVGSDEFHAGLAVRQSPEEMLPVGARWEREPAAIQITSRRQNGRTFYLPSGAVSVSRTDAGTVVVIISQTKEIENAGSNKFEYFPVISVPGEKSIITLESPSISGFRSGLKVHTFRTNDDRLSECDSFNFGIAILDLAGKLKRSKLALKDRPSTHVLPLPVVGQVMDFKLKGAEGTFVCGEDYRGRYLLIDCWASWCVPCMKKMPELKELSEEYGDSLSVIGVNFDQDLDDFKQIKNKVNTPWRQIHAANSAGVHGDAWSEISRIEHLPRLFLLSPEGKLICDFNPIELKDVLARELKTP